MVFSVSSVFSVVSFETWYYCVRPIQQRNSPTMNKWLLTLLTIVLLPSYISAGQAPSPEKIIDRYIKATGGAKALKRITSANFTGTVINPATGERGLFN